MSIIFLFVGCEDNSVKPEDKNQSPKIFSLSVFPNVIGPQDSVIVICNAFDPDGDTLVYDWFTDGKSKIKGAFIYEETHLWHTFENTCIVYPKNLNNIPVDTLWIQCFARDRKGKSDNRLIDFILIQ
jgi:hypothetical protein